jgi:murE/murF fusion protein
MKLTALLDQIDELELAGGRADGVDVSAVTFDSREVTEGALFVALDGVHVDGHRFVEAAADAGAAGVVVNRDRLPLDVDCTVLACADTRHTLGLVAEVFFGRPSSELCMVGVTGTNGKTTTAWMLDAIFRAANCASGLIGTIGYRWPGHEESAVNTTPESLVVQRLLGRMRDAGVECVAMEVSSHGLSTHRLRGTYFDAAIFTNLTQDHLDFHGDMDAYREAKARLFETLLPASARAGKEPKAIINIDDDHGAWFAGRALKTGVDAVTFGIGDRADWRAVEVEQTLGGSRFFVEGPEERFQVESPLPGAFNVSNALAAAVAARLVGLSVDHIRAGFSELGHVPGRMQRVHTSQGLESATEPSVFVDYAHTPDALARALATVRPMAGGRLIVVFGCGGDRDRDKRQPMGREAADAADIVVVTSDNPRTESPEAIISQILEGVKVKRRLGDDELGESDEGVWVEADRGRAIDAAITHARADDVVLIAGKGHETYQEVDGMRASFDDVERATRALQERSAGAERAASRVAKRRIAGWSLEKVAAACDGRLVDAATSGLSVSGQPVSGVTSDTRALRAGQLFVALRGENFDAHDFLDQAKAKGAAAVMVDRSDVDTDLPMIIVEDTLDGLTALGRAIWREATDEGLHTIDVTGSNGKTTVKEMLALLWGTRGDVFATPGNLNNHIGVPLVLCDLPQICDHLVLELGANAPDEILHLVGLAPGTERIITSIGVAHIEGFGSVDGIRRAKSEIFEHAGAETTAIVPFSEVDNLIAADFCGQVITVGFEEGADLRIELLEPDTASEEALRFDVEYKEHRSTICLPIPGAHHALNAGTALATLFARGLEPRADLCNAALSKLALPHGRWSVVDRGEVCFIDDAYNANPSSVKASFDAFMGTSDSQNRPRVAIIGEMLELGRDATRWHCEVSAAIASRERLDAFVAVGPFAQAMAEAARTNGHAQLEVRGFESVEDAARWLASQGPAFVFLKASRGAKLERVVDLMEPKGEKRRADQAPQ